LYFLLWSYFTYKFLHMIKSIIYWPAFVQFAGYWRIKMKFRRLMLSLLLMMLGTVAVSAGEETDKLPATGTHRSPSSEGASVGFKTLQDGDLVPPTFTVKFQVSGMGIAPAGSMIDNTGHHHLLIDVTDLPATDHIRHFGKGQTEAELTLPEGEHTLQLLFADYSHTPHEPPVMSDKITITVSADAPPRNEDEE